MPESRYGEVVRALETLVTGGVTTYSRLFELLFPERDETVAPAGEIRFGTLDEEFEPASDGRGWMSQALMSNAPPEKPAKFPEYSMISQYGRVHPGWSDRGMHLSPLLLASEKGHAHPELLLTVCHEFIHNIQNRAFLSFEGDLAAFLEQIGPAVAALWEERTGQPMGEGAMRPREIQTRVVEILIQGAMEWERFPRTRIELWAALSNLGCHFVKEFVSESEKAEMEAAKKQFPVSPECAWSLHATTSSLDILGSCISESSKQNGQYFCRVVIPSLVKALCDILGMKFSLPDYDPSTAAQARTGRFFWNVTMMPETAAEMSATLGQFFRAIDAGGYYLHAVTALDTWLGQQRLTGRHELLSGPASLDFMKEIRGHWLADPLYAKTVGTVLDFSWRSDRYRSALFELCDRAASDIQILSAGAARQAINGLLDLLAEKRIHAAMPVSAGQVTLEKPLLACFLETDPGILKDFSPTEYARAKAWKWCDRLYTGQVPESSFAISDPGLSPMARLAAAVYIVNVAGEKPLPTEEGQKAMARMLADIASGSRALVRDLETGPDNGRNITPFLSVHSAGRLADRAEEAAQTLEPAARDEFRKGHPGLTDQVAQWVKQIVGKFKP
ncbi:MAG: hypothetical protein M3O22_05825 [Pseudomonadota bacterium]|nr:hypothetical protein [Pseudomonadota bacterium]